MQKLLPALACIWAALDEDQDPRPLAAYRISVFLGLLLHFGPSFLALDENFGEHAYRTQEWNRFLFESLPVVPPSLVIVLAYVTVLSFVCGILGIGLKVAAGCAGVCCYVFASWNGLPYQTLALSPLWLMLPAWCLFGGGTDVWTVWRKRTPSSVRTMAYAGTVSTLVLWQLCVTVWFAGVEKIRAGWLDVNEMAVLFFYPKGFVLRDWAVDVAWLQLPAVGQMATWGTIVLELALPILLFVPRWRKTAAIFWFGGFALVTLLMAVPSLFFFVFAPGAALAFAKVPKRTLPQHHMLASE